MTGRDRSGMSLIELVVALAVATVAFLALFGALYSSAGLDRHTRERSVAMARAQTVLEDLLGRPWDDLPAQDGQLFTVPYELEPGNTLLLPPAAGLAQPGDIAVTTWGATGLRRLRVRVRWRTGNAGETAEVALETLVGRR